MDDYYNINNIRFFIQLFSVMKEKKYFFQMRKIICLIAFVRKYERIVKYIFYVYITSVEIPSILMVYVKIDTYFALTINQFNRYEMIFLLC